MIHLHHLLAQHGQQPVNQEVDQQLIVNHSLVLICLQLLVLANKQRRFHSHQLQQQQEE